MGASVIAYWPHITAQQIEAQPGFWNDDRAWGNWMAEREGNAAIASALQHLGSEALLTYKTDGMDDEDVHWVRPKDLRDAATTLRDAVRGGLPETQIILETYARHANRIDPVVAEFTRDLDDIIALTQWAENEGASRMTLEVNW